MNSALFFARVSAGYRGRAALHAVTADLRPGLVTGLVGPNGAGKTTLLRVGLGLLEPQQGQVLVFGKPLAGLTKARLAQLIAYLPQGADSHWPVPVERIVMLGRIPHLSRFASASNADRMLVDEALERADCTVLRHRRMDELSAGERARVLLARALATGAPALLVDEPAAHLDPVHQLRLMELLRNEAERGTAVLVTLHDLTLASRFCDELLVLQSGHLVAQAAPDAALSDASLANVFSIVAVRAGFPARKAIVPWTRI